MEFLRATASELWRLHVVYPQRATNDLGDVQGNQESDPFGQFNPVQYRRHGSLHGRALEQSPDWRFILSGTSGHESHTAANPAPFHLRRVLLRQQSWRVAGAGVRYQPVL